MQKKLEMPRRSMHIGVTRLNGPPAGPAQT